ncbi:uncharacterized protein Tco025E_10054 [Trypanosoma conorhini]|uniref:Mucin-associated surface protein (MASP) n=1 Tax=Trypanosoma conorhini TaxID=83891 RepID=A0A422MSV2_9TRYP|nr:uncharacterized protein Tco025E_10054 [Trypanosoma conorhini]RNE96298.1 hypothetical protein Tco025E_10054 [Trypanosoma conorhini]
MGNSRGTGVVSPQAAPPPPPPQVLSSPQTGKGVGRAQSTTEDASKEQKEGEATALAEGARANQPTESSKQSPAHSSPAAEGEDAVVGGPTQEGTVGKAAAEASPPESAVQQNAVQRDNTRASTAVAGETSEAAQDTAGGGGSNNSGSNSGSGSAAQPQPASSVATTETGDAQQKELPTFQSQTEKSGGSKEQAAQPAAGVAAQAATTTNVMSAAKAVPGDSDGSSTVAAHSASPVALLLLLACAAAAAVLAA